MNPITLQNPIDDFNRHQDYELHKTGEAFGDFFKVIGIILIVVIIGSRFSK
jgi:hypothetical protein